MKPAHMIALIVIAITMGVTLYSFSGAIAKHVTLEQAIHDPGVTLQVPGKILKNTVTYDPSKGGLRFKIADMNNPSEVMQVVYDQPKPQNFDTATSVEVVGQYGQDGVFHASTLLVKCPSKYSDAAK